MEIEPPADTDVLELDHGEDDVDVSGFITSEDDDDDVFVQGYSRSQKQMKYWELEEEVENISDNWNI